MFLAVPSAAAEALAAAASALAGDERDIITLPLQNWRISVT